MLEIHNLSVKTLSIPILHEVSLKVHDGSVHALMGQNGSGKSTLANVLAGHPHYEITAGSIVFNGEDLISMSPDERAKAGVFLAFQYPFSIPGVSVAHFLRLVKNTQEKSQGLPVTKLAPFLKELKEIMKSLELPWAFAQRSVNDQFSGGEKKRLEMVQMLVLKPKLVILDEIDSGLDIDAIKHVAKAIETLRSQMPKTSWLIITHYQRLLNYVPVDYVHIMNQGNIQQTGGPELVEHLEKFGYADLIKLS